jgi:hypothetical protein
MTDIIRDLGDNLYLKQGTIEDVERLADYNARQLSDEGPDQPEEMLRHWTEDLMTNHPTAGPGDFSYVEDTKTGQIVSSLCMIPQNWSYEAIPFGVGRVEMVSTHRDYRRKGLVRAQFEVFHQWSQAKGHKLQAITGIPYFYRQFGYEMTLSLGGARRGYRPHIPKLKDDESEPYQIRPAEPNDIPFIGKMYDRGRNRSLISCIRDENIWRYEMLEQHQSFRGDMCIIANLEAEPVGFMWHSNRLHNSGLGLFSYELKSGISWAAVTPTVIRYLERKGEEFADKDEDKDWEAFTFDLGTHHPTYDIAEKYLPEKIDPYTWYIRVADLPDFIQHISKVLNRRLSESEFCGYQGELFLDFHRAGLKLTLENGKITTNERWQPSTENRGDLAFPDHAFLHLLCGYRSFNELEAFYPDCYRRKKTEAQALINVLFPKKPSQVLGVV